MFKIDERTSYITFIYIVLCQMEFRSERGRLFKRWILSPSEIIYQ